MADFPDKDIKHIYNRFGFGLKPGQYEMASGQSKRETIDALFKTSSRYSPLIPIVSVVERVTMLSSLSEEEKKKLFTASRQNILQIGVNWLNKMVDDKDQLRERLVLFWHDHFASSAKWDILIYRQNETLRKHALGSFRDLLHAMCQDPMLLQYLDNDKNRKQSPNENFTRELLELFTMGEGHYSETDIREGARAFTGHAFNLQGQYVFRPQAHDYGPKTFMGKTGRLDATHIIDIILEQKQTARHICRKFYRYFVNPKVDEKIVEDLADDFYHSDYNIEELIRNILESDWFYSKANEGTKIKSPIDLLVGLMKQCSVEFHNHQLLVRVSRVMGQVPFHPPNVAGWPLGKQWIDSTSLLFRMRLADFVILGQNIQSRGKDPFTMEAMQNMDLDDKFFDSNEAVKFDLSALKRLAGEGSTQERIQNLAAYLLNSDLNHSQQVLQQWVDPELDILDLIIMNILRMPEYQLC